MKKSSTTESSTTVDDDHPLTISYREAAAKINRSTTQVFNVVKGARRSRYIEARIRPYVKDLAKFEAGIGRN